MICILNVMISILFWNELSLVMKNGLFTITSFESDHGPSVMNHNKQHRKLNCVKKNYAVCWVRLEISVIFWAASKEPNDYSGCAPSDYYLFRSLQNSLNGKTFNDDEAARAEILVGHRSGPDREKCGPDRVICLAPDQ